MTTDAEQGRTPGERRLDALTNLNEARHRQVLADAEEETGGDPGLTEDQLVAADDVEDAERELWDSTLAWVKAEGLDQRKPPTEQPGHADHP